MTDKLVNSLWEAIEREGYFKEDVLSSSRKREFVDVRVALSQLLYYRLGLTQYKIALILNRHEHSTINHYVNHMDERDNFDYKELTRVLNRVVDKYEEHIEKFQYA
tara:strand:- start:2842 stop:3159 length:318 start_codon:yes stop_codon:yes gene_type:complete